MGCLWPVRSSKALCSQSFFFCLQQVIAGRRCWQQPASLPAAHSFGLRARSGSSGRSLHESWAGLASSPVIANLCARAQGDCSVPSSAVQVLCHAGPCRGNQKKCTVETNEETAKSPKKHAGGLASLLLSCQAVAVAAAAPKVQLLAEAESKESPPAAAGPRGASRACSPASGLGQSSLPPPASGRQKTPSDQNLVSLESFLLLTGFYFWIHGHLDLAFCQLLLRASCRQQSK